MILYFLLLFVVLFLHFTISRVKIGANNNRNEIFKQKISYLLVTLILVMFSILRDGIGIDYSSYMTHVSNIQQGLPVYMENGFQCLCQITYYFNQNPRTVLVIMSIFTIVIYLKAIYNLSENIQLSLLLFLSWGYYFFTFLSVRNYFALALTFYSLTFLKNANYKLFLPLLVLAAQFHKSAYICFVLYLLASIKINKNRLIGVSLLIIVLAFIFTDQARSIVFIFYPGYENSVYDNNRVSFLNIIKATITVAIGYLYYSKFKNCKRDTIMFNLNVMSFICYVGFYWLPEISRIGFYMNVTSIVFLPNVIERVSNSKTKTFYKLCLFSGSIILFVLLMEEFYSPNTALLPYKTWIEAGY